MVEEVQEYCEWSRVLVVCPQFNLITVLYFSGLHSHVGPSPKRLPNDAGAVAGEQLSVAVRACSGEG